MEDHKVCLAIHRENIKRLNNAFRNYNKDCAARKTAPYLSTRLEKLEALFPEIAAMHLQLIQMEDVDEISKYCAESTFDKAEEVYFDFKTELREGLSALQPPAPPIVQQQLLQQGPPPPVAPHENANINVNDNHRDFRLPTIAVPNFDGDYHSWPSFKNSFQHLVADNLTLSNLQRLHYLKGSLTADAKRLV